MFRDSEMQDIAAGMMHLCGMYEQLRTEMDRFRETFGIEIKIDDDGMQLVAIWEDDEL